MPDQDDAGMQATKEIFDAAVGQIAANHDARQRRRQFEQMVNAIRSVQEQSEVQVEVVQYEQEKENEPDKQDQGRETSEERDESQEPEREQEEVEPKEQEPKEQEPKEKEPEKKEESKKEETPERDASDKKSEQTSPVKPEKPKEEKQHMGAEIREEIKASIDEIKQQRDELKSEIRNLRNELVTMRLNGQNIDDIQKKADIINQKTEEAIGMKETLRQKRIDLFKSDVLPVKNTYNKVVEAIDQKIDAGKQAIGRMGNEVKLANAKFKETGKESAYLGVQNRCAEIYRGWEQKTASLDSKIYNGLNHIANKTESFHEKMSQTKVALKDIATIWRGKEVKVEPTKEAAKPSFFRKLADSVKDRVINKAEKVSNSVDKTNSKIQEMSSKRATLGMKGKSFADVAQKADAVAKKMNSALEKTTAAIQKVAR